MGVGVGNPPRRPKSVPLQACSTGRFLLCVCQFVLVTRQHESGDVYTLLLVLTLSLFIPLDTGDTVQPTTLAKNLE